MRFLVDECTGPAVARWLRAQGHDVFSVYGQARGADDEELIRLAFAQKRILITNDKDFGEKVFRERFSHRGVILLRLQDERARVKIRVLEQLLERHAEHLPDKFVVVTEHTIRFSQIETKHE